MRLTKRQLRKLINEQFGLDPVRGFKSIPDKLETAYNFYVKHGPSTFTKGYEEAKEIEQALNKKLEVQFGLSAEEVKDNTSSDNVKLMKPNAAAEDYSADVSPDAKQLLDIDKKAVEKYKGKYKTHEPSASNSYDYVELGEDGILTFYNSYRYRQPLEAGKITVLDTSETALSWLNWFSKNQDKKITKKEVEPEAASTPGASKAAVSKKGGKYNAKTEGIQKIIDPNAKHTKADGQWGKGTQRAWEEYVSSSEFELAMGKTYPNVSDEETMNIIDGLPKKATIVKKLGYKANTSGVLSFLQDVSDDEIIRTDIKLGDVTSGSDKAALEKVIDGSEMPDDKFIEDVDADLFGEKLKGEKPKNKDRLINKLADAYRDRRDEKQKKRLAKKVRRMLKDDPKALAAFNAATKSVGLEESLSRGELYRRRYWGRY
jgi:hypothetical protein|tara:strand:+ start:7435 stop:8724 length:1290 start_codon:yes stop_codon:yes gene_type:complete